MRKTAELLLLLAGLLFVLGVLSDGAAMANVSGQAVDQRDIWYDVNESTIRGQGQRFIIPSRYRMLAADLTALDALLATAPLENSQAARLANVIMPLPLPDGTVGQFRIEDSPIMEPELAAKFPEIKTYLGQGIDDPTATVRFDQTPAGFHAMILSSDSTIYIDPYRRGDTAHYISYYKHDFSKDGATLNERLPNRLPQLPSSPESSQSVVPVVSVGEQLRTYRLAMAATGEYTEFHGGSVAQGLAAVTTTVNRVSGIFEREIAVRLQLVANNNQIIYTDSASDPYNKDLASENQANLDSVIGDANYDVGHVVTVGGGGVAETGPCITGNKAKGMTGSDEPIGDPFDVDYVAHEIGHQFNANHTFNAGKAGACDESNRWDDTAYEPGSGSTILSYAGICEPQNLQQSSDDYFHTISFDEMVTYITSEEGSCAITTATGNSAPSVEAGQSYNIPARTPFMLTGSATDADPNSLTYAWEQFDKGAAWTQDALPNTDTGSGPIFRSYKPVTSPSRTFPALANILDGSHSNDGESLPTRTRTLTFRLTARDNQAGGGGVAYDTVTLNVTSDAGPFAVTAPNSALTWNGGSQQNVTWDVANTTAAPISCSSVNILLSTDGGSSFSHTLASGSANDGSEMITVPNAPSTSARVKVQCANNIFFDISNADFTITAGGATSTPTPASSATATAQAAATATQPAPTATQAAATATQAAATATPVGSANACSSPNVTIPDNSNGVSDNLELTDAGTITDLNVSIKATYPFMGDLIFTLEHDTGTTVTLIDRVDYPSEKLGCEEENIEVTLDDEADLAVENQCELSDPAINGTFKPHQPLSGFDGEDLSGSWTLTVNNAEEVKTGTLVEWCLIPTTSGSGETATPTPMATSSPTPMATSSPTSVPSSYELYLPLLVR